MLHYNHRNVATLVAQVRRRGRGREGGGGAYPYLFSDWPGCDYRMLGSLCQMRSLDGARRRLTMRLWRLAFPRKTLLFPQSLIRSFCRTRKTSAPLLVSESIKHVCLIFSSAPIDDVCKRAPNAPDLFYVLLLPLSCLEPRRFDKGQEGEVVAQSPPGLFSAGVLGALRGAVREVAARWRGGRHSAPWPGNEVC